MGTNYYARIKADKEKRDELVELITREDTAYYDRIVELANELYGDAFFVNSEQSLIGSVIHIGKKSYGWKFLWEHHLYIVKNGHIEERDIGKGRIKIEYVDDPDTLYSLYGKLSKKNIREFIMREDIDIYDEYGELQNKEEFIEWAFNTDGLDSITSQERKRETVYQNEEWLEPIKMAGYEKKVKKNATDFYCDGLRFALFRDFR